MMMDVILLYVIFSSIEIIHSMIFFLVLLCLKSWLIQVVLWILDDASQSGATNQMLLPVGLVASEAKWDKLVF
jgi:hypothetical protein